MINHAQNRELILEALKRELVGPAPAGREIDITRDLVFDSWEELRQPFRQKGSGEEILLRDPPIKRYGVGVLFPSESPLEDREVDAGDVPADGWELPEPEVAAQATYDEESDVSITDEADEFDLSLANSYQPSTMGVSFLAEFPTASILRVNVEGGRYLRRKILVRGERRDWERDWWVRVPVSFRVEFDRNRLTLTGSRRLVAAATNSDGHFPLLDAVNIDDLDLRVEVFSRPHPYGRRLLTVCLINRTPPPELGAPNAQCLFQAGFEVSVHSSGNSAHILPYPSARMDNDPEQQALELLYRHAQTFATGHGCSADWGFQVGTAKASSVRTASLPVVETPQITPEIEREDKTLLTVNMAALSGLIENEDGFSSLQEIIDRYEDWIEERREDITTGTLETRYDSAAWANIDQCETALRRMKDGLAYLRADETAREAFRLANHAILLQQLATGVSTREVSFDASESRLKIASRYSDPDPLNPPEGRGEWRPFQIAFLLASIRSAADGEAPDRELVELIWFPTGGGKTEAYLGLAAFSMFKRRIDDPEDSGVNVLMRYTLRLLTAQQFQRATGLTCAMEFLRRDRDVGLGTTPFSIGIWLGGTTTPNTRDDASRKLTQFERQRSGKNPFLLTRCPWCGAEFKRLEARPAGRGRSLILTPGLTRQQVDGMSGPSVHFVCPDDDCPFSSGLPIYIIDEDVYDIRPTFVIGTIDKFAMLAWRPEARSIFGLDREGDRISSPPGLIIQDELHLISGPLGSLAGLYETTIENLCTDHRVDPPIPPKIVSSTATIRGYKEQIKALYARPESSLFPPPGLDASDSFFARYDTERPGRKYVGVHAVSLGSVQTEWVRAFTALAQSPTSLDDEGRDPWWTMLVFFNSIREMGTAHTLFQSDVPDYARVLWEREGIERGGRRYLNAVQELTGGLDSDDIVAAIHDLEVSTHDSTSRPIDVCLASNIIEVGIDIPRLSLMVVAGQPKTTSQYIQVTGRVGRLRDRPGLVVTLYSPSKPRDRSHFERFRDYHERLYAQVEPTSVTPFSAPALDRALHAVMVSYVRQAGAAAVADRPYPYPKHLIDEFRRLVLDRVDIVDPEERETVIRLLGRREREWQNWHRTRWQGGQDNSDAPLLRRAGAYADPKDKALSWSTLMSMRNVDAECEVEITTSYIEEMDFNG